MSICYRLYNMLIFEYVIARHVSNQTICMSIKYCIPQKKYLVPAASISDSVLLFLINLHNSLAPSVPRLLCEKF